MDTNANVKELVGRQVKSFVIGVRFGNVVQVISSVVGHFDEGMPALRTAAG